MALLMTLLATVTPCSQLLLREESPQESPVPTGLRGCSVPALVHDDWGDAHSMATLAKLLLSHASGGWASRDCHEHAAPSSEHRAVWRSHPAPRSAQAALLG